MKGLLLCQLVAFAIMLQISSRLRASPLGILAILMLIIAITIIFTSRVSQIEQFDTAQPVTFGSIIEIQHSNCATQSPTSSFMNSHPAVFWRSGSSGQNMVVIDENLHQRTMWKIKGDLSAGSDVQGQPVVDGSLIRLEDCWSGRNMHSHPISNGVYDMHEATGFGNGEQDDGNSLWLVSVDGGGSLTLGKKFRLKHQATGFYLLSIPNVAQQLYQNAAVGSRWVVGTSPLTLGLQDPNCFWNITRAEAADKRAVRFYKDPSKLADVSMDDYQLVGPQDVTITKIRDGRAGFDYLKSMIVPAGYSVDFYRDVQKQQFATTVEAGLSSNIDIGPVASAVIRSYCAVLAYESCNFGGKSACVPLGVKKLGFDVQSWRTSPGAQARIHGPDFDVDVKPGEIQSCWKTRNPTAIGMGEISAGSSKGYISWLSRQKDDPSSLISFASSRQDKLVPSVQISNLATYLHAGRPESYSGGRVWRDLSGNNRHFVWQTQPRLSNGWFKSTDKNGINAIGPPANSFNLSTGNQGMTSMLVVQAWGIGNGTGYSFPDVNADMHGWSCHVPWGDGILYSDIAGYVGNSRCTLQAAAWNPSSNNVIIIRRSAIKSGGLQSVWLNGKKVAESAVRTPELKLGANNVKLVDSLKSNLQAFAVYNTDLQDDEIVNLTSFMRQEQMRVHSTYEQAILDSMSKDLPSFPVVSGLRCLLDARDARSAQFGNRIWKDISGNGKDFTWATVPNISNGRFVNIDQAGQSAVGPPADSFGIEPDGGGYTIFVVAKTNKPSQNQAFRFPGQNPNSRGIFCHPTWTDNNIYFDQSGCCASNSQRVQIASQPGYCVMACRKTPNFAFNDNVLKSAGQDIMSSDKLQKLAIFVNGAIKIEGTAAAAATSLDYRAVELGKSAYEGLDWQADIGGFAVYNRALTNEEILVVSAWLNTPYVGSTRMPNGNIDNSPNIQPGVCVNKTYNGKVYSNTECLSMTAQSDGTYATVPATGEGWCFTSETDNTKRGYCRKASVIDRESKYDRSKSLTYTQAMEHCESKGGRLCNKAELCDAGANTRPGIGFNTLNQDECKQVGGVYNFAGKYCGTAESQGQTPLYIPPGEQWAAVNDDANSWAYVGSDQSKMCRTYDQLNGQKPSWGLDTSKPDLQKNVVCCGINSTDRCTLLQNELKTAQQALPLASTAAEKQEYSARIQDLTERLNKECLKKPYLDVVSEYNSNQDAVSMINTNITRSKEDRDNLNKVLNGLRSYQDANNTSFSSQAQAQKQGKAFPQAPFFKPLGQGPDLESNIAQTQSLIQQEQKRFAACPGNPDCQQPLQSRSTGACSGFW